MNIDKYSAYAKPVLRVGLAFVYLYFGLNQIFNTNAFIGWLPTEAQYIPLEAATLVLINGIFETLLAILLLSGFFVRINAFLLSIHMLGIIIFSVGFTEIGVRDFGILTATIAIFLQGNDKYCLENKLKKVKKGKR